MMTGCSDINTFDESVWRAQAGSTARDIVERFVALEKKHDPFRNGKQVIHLLGKPDAANRMLISIVCTLRYR